jgi:cytochrome c biogenesis protein CcmG, thiol:disulfide interchange protein DsbE
MGDDVYGLRQVLAGGLSLQHGMRCIFRSGDAVYGRETASPEGTPQRSACGGVTVRFAMKALAREETFSSPLHAVAGAVLIVGLLAAFAFLPRLFGAKGEQVGQDAPNITVPLVANAGELTEPPAAPPTTVTLGELKGHAVLLDFWASWCGPCKAEAPIIDRIATRFKSRGLVVIGVNTSDEEGLGVAWAQAHHLSYPIAFDGSSAAARAFDVEGLPTMVIISKTGKIIGRRSGMTDGDEIERLVNQAL